MAITTTINATQIGQAQRGLEADYYEMEAWETSSDDVSGSGNLNYQEVELKIDKDMLEFGTGLDAVDESEPAMLRNKSAEEASFFTQADSAPVKEMAQAGPAIPVGDGFSASPLADIQSFTAPPVTNLESSESTTRVQNVNDAPDTTTNNGPTTISTDEDGNTINIYNYGSDCCGGCCIGDGGDTIINVDTTITNVINVAADIITIGGDIINIGGDIINIDLGGGGDGGISINPDINIDLGDVFNSTIGIIVDLGDTLNIGGDLNLELIGIDVDAIIDLGLGDGLNLGVDLGLGDLPLLGDDLEDLLSLDVGLGDGGLNLDASFIGGDLLDLGLDLGEDGLGLDTGLGLPPLLGQDGLSLLDIDLDLGNGLGLDTDLLGEDLLDLGLLGEDGLSLDLLGEDLLGGDDPLGGVTGIVDDLLGGGTDDPLGGVTDVVEDVLGGEGNPLDGLLDGLGDGLGGGELLDVELLNDDGALADVDLFGDDLIGDGGLLGEVVGEDGILDGVTDDLGGALDLVDLELGGGDSGGLNIDTDLGGGDILDIDLLGDGLLDVDLAGNDLLGGDDLLGGTLDDVIGGDAGGGGMDIPLDDLVAPVVDILPDVPIIPDLPNLFGGWN